MKTIREEQHPTEQDHATVANAVNKRLVVTATVVNGGNTAVPTSSVNHNGGPPQAPPPPVTSTENNQQHFRKILPGEPTTRKVLSKRPKASSQPPIAEELQANFE